MVVQDDEFWGRFLLFQRLKPQILGQIAPVGIGGFDQIHLPWPVPVFQLLLSRNGQFHCAELFEINQPLEAVFLGEAGHDALTVLVNALH